MNTHHYQKLARSAFTLALATGIMWLALSFLLPIDQDFMAAVDRHQVYWSILVVLGLAASWMGRWKN